MAATSTLPTQAAARFAVPQDLRPSIDPAKVMKYIDDLRRGSSNNHAEIDSLKKQSAKSQSEVLRLTSTLSIQQAQLEFLRMEKADHLAQQSQWAAAAAEYELLIDLKEGMVSIMGVGSTARTESKIQLARYQNCLGHSYLKTNTLTNAEQWTRKAWDAQKEVLGSRRSETRQSFCQLCQVLSQSDNIAKNLEGERLLYAAWHQADVDDFAMRCALQLGKTYIQQKRNLEAYAELSGLWDKQSERGTPTQSLMETANYILVSLKQQPNDQAVMDWRYKLWKGYPQDFVHTLPNEAFELARDLTLLKRWADAGNIS